MPFTSGIVSGLSRDNVRSWRGEISFGPMLSITFERSRRRPSPSITPGFSEPGLPYRHSLISSCPHRSSTHFPDDATIGGRREAELTEPLQPGHRTGGCSSWRLTAVDGKVMPIYDAAMEYQKRGTPLMIFAGHESGTGSSRDWAAKGTRLLGV